MKRSKIVVLLVVALAAIMVLSSCGAGSAKKFAELLDGSRYEDPAPSWTTSAKIDALQNAQVIDDQGDLVVLAKENADGFYTYMIFNMKTGTVVYSATETAAVDVDIDLGETDNYDADYAVVVLTTWVLDGDNNHTNEYSYVVSLLDATGAQFATATRMTGLPETRWDLLRFEGKCYRVDKEGKFTEAGDYSDFAPLPNIVAETEKYYYAINAGTVIVYDKTLAIVSYYNMPTYANAGAQAFALDAEKVIVQYTVNEDPYTDDYDILAAGGTKQSLHTFILNPDGKAKEIRCDYVIIDGGLLTEADKDQAGVSDSFTNYAIVCPVEDQHVNNSATARKWATMDKNGKIKELQGPTLVPFNNFNFVNTNRWVFNTADGRAYLVNEKAEVIGEVTGANLGNGRSYFTANGKVYDYDLNVTLDYTAANYTIMRRLNHSVIFRNVDNEPVLFANGTRTTLIAKDVVATKQMVQTGDGYFAILDTTNTEDKKFIVYNDLGAPVLTLIYEAGFMPQIEATSDNHLLVSQPSLDTTTATVTHTFYLVG